MEKTIRKIRNFSRYRELFVLPVLAALLLLAAELFLSRKKLP